MHKKHRDYKITKKYIKYFWKQCAVCKNDFKKEWLWCASWWEAYSGDLLHNKIWFCTKCISTEKEIDEFMAKINLGAVL